MPSNESIDEIKHLKTAVDQLKLRDQALDTMIDRRTLEQARYNRKKAHFEVYEATEVSIGRDSGLVKP